jgi:hypothetical protein
MVLGFEISAFCLLDRHFTFRTIPPRPVCSGYFGDRDLLFFPRLVTALVLLFTFLATAGMTDELTTQLFLLRLTLVNFLPRLS